MNFKDFIGQNHPDPDSLLNPKFDQLCTLAQEYAKSLQLIQSCVISRFRYDSKTVEITETELRGLIFWATAGIEKSNGGSYHSVVEFIKDNYKFMTYQKSRYKKLVFGSRLKNGL